MILVSYSYCSLGTCMASSLLLGGAQTSRAFRHQPIELCPWPVNLNCSALLLILPSLLRQSTSFPDNPHTILCYSKDAVAEGCRSLAIYACSISRSSLLHLFRVSFITNL